MTSKTPLIITLLVMLSSCSPFPYADSPQAAEPIMIHLSSDLAWMEMPLEKCAGSLPETVLFIEYENLEDGQDADLYISLGAPQNSANYDVFLVGEEKIILVANKLIDLNSLDLTAIRSAYQFLNPKWQAWGYPTSNPANQVFSDVILQGEMSSPHVGLAPNPSAMIDAVVSNPKAIGFIPQTWFSDEVQEIPLDAEQQDALVLPILGMTDGAPSHAARSMLSCLNQSVQP